ncbi:MAG: hypothetical protein HQM13_04730 [SAR324 cluster bacterium]|nr:hypothetical protein [SAR324 cluster bacterium]
MNLTKSDFFVGMTSLTLLFWIQSVYPKEVYAHRPEITEVKVYLSSNNQFRIEIISDVLNFIKKEFENEAQHRGSANFFEQMASDEIESLLTLAEQRFLSELKIQNQRGEEISVKKPSFLNVGRLRKAMQISNNNQHVISVVTLRGNLPSGIKSLQIQLPKDLGKSVLQIIRTERQELEAAEASKPIMLKSADEQSDNILNDSLIFLKKTVEQFFPGEASLN